MNGMNAMNAMKRLVIENFQSHQKTTVEFAPAGGLTVIVGPSDTGKTVIIRALRWLFFNQPQGTEFIRTGATLVRATLEYESGHKVIRERTVSTNRYKIVAPGAEKPEVFEGFGNNVPLEMQEITGVRSVRIGDDNYTLNLSEQLDGPFLGTKQISSPARAKVLGKMAGTEEIDMATSEVGTDLYRRGQDEKRLKSEITEKKEAIKQYGYLPGLKAKIEQLQDVLDTIKAAQERKTKLENLRFSLATVNQNIDQCDRIIKRWQRVGEAENIVSLQEQIIQRKRTIQSHQLNWIAVNQNIDQCNCVISRWQGIDDTEKILFQQEQLIQRKETIQTCQSNLLAIEQGIRNAQSVLTRLLYLPEAEDMVTMVETLSPRLKWLKEFKMALTKVNTLQSGAEIILNRWEKLSEMEQAKSQVVELTEKRRTLVGLKHQLQTAEENIETVRQNAVVWEQRVAELEGAYKDALLAAGVCPTCGTELTPESLKRAV